MGILIIILIAVLVIICIVKANETATENKPDAAGLHIHKNGLHGCKSLEDLINSISYGGIYPYSTGMTVEEVKSTLLLAGLTSQTFEDSLKFSQLTMGMHSISLPCPPSQSIKEVTFRLSPASKVCSFSVRLSDEAALKVALVLLCQRFGTPFSKSSEFIIWRDLLLNVINLDLSKKTINIINELALTEQPTPLNIKTATPKANKKGMFKAGDKFKTFLFMHTKNEDGSHGEIVVDIEHEIIEVTNEYVIYKDIDGNIEKKDIQSFREMTRETRYFKWIE
jgi:hypothetical protein